MSRDLIIYIDEEKEAHDHIYNLRKAIGEHFEYEAIFPSRTIEQTIDKLLSYGTRLAAIVLDEKLSSTGMAIFWGSELAQAYRDFDDKIPICLLTNEPSHIAVTDGDYEFVIGKPDMYEEDKSRIFGKKLRRYIDGFNVQISDREKRLEELVRQSVIRGLTTEEVEELQTLESWRTRPEVLQEELANSKLNADLLEKEEILAKLKQKFVLNR